MTPPGIRLQDSRSFAREQESDHSSDYGSDIDLDDAEDILSLIESQNLYPRLPLLEILPVINSPDVVTHEQPSSVVALPLQGYTIKEDVSITHTTTSESSVRTEKRRKKCSEKQRTPRRNKINIEYENSATSSSTGGTGRVEPDSSDVPQVSEPLAIEPSQASDSSGMPTPPADARSPYDRFRSRRNALSVTDLVSNVWCEKQFQYTLERGFKRTTPEMKRGTKVHKVLEDEVHITVPVQVTTPEDRWGLKLFNICQGLSTLKETGMTRELPVFGFMKDVFVNGVIDEISYTPPEATDTKKEKKEPTNPKKRGRPRKSESASSLSPPPKNPVAIDSLEIKRRTIYLSDLKTRSSRSTPGSSQLRAAALQLMLYHNLLENMRSLSVDFSRLLSTFNLDGFVPFSDSFISQVASLDSSIPLEDFLENNSLWGIWGILGKMIVETVDEVGKNLSVSYRSQKDGTIMKVMVFNLDQGALETHVEDTMKWWNGERESVGVEIEEAWKCRMCEFESNCTWRLGKIEELRLGKFREKEKSPLRPADGG